MPDRPDSSQTIGLEINFHVLRGVELGLRKGKPCLEKSFEIPLDVQALSKPEQGNPLKDSEQWTSLRDPLSKLLVSTSLNANEVLVRQIEVKLKKEADIDAVLAFQSEPLLPFPVENAVIDRIKVGETPDGTVLTLLAGRKDHIEHHLQIWKILDVDPEIITAAPAALEAFAKQFCSSEHAQFIVHLGHSHIPCVLIRDRKLVAAQACHQGIHSLMQAYALDAGSESASGFSAIDFAEINKEKYPHLTESLENLRMDITRTLYSLAKQVKGQEVGQIVITGEGGTFLHLGAFLCQSMNKPLTGPVIDPHFAMSIPELQKFAIPIGAALMSLPLDFDQINFRQQELAYPNPLRRFKKPVGIFIGLSLLLGVAFYFMGASYISKRENQLRTEYSELLASMNKPYTQFEKDYAIKTSGKKDLVIEQVPSITSLSEEDIAGRLAFLEKEIRATPDIYPLLPNVPTVSDVLAWFSVHPKVVSRDPKTGSVKPLLQLESFSYSMVKRPEQTKKQEKYQVKVEMEFSASSHKAAREFHDALLAPNDIVDPKSEIKWSTNRALFRASFYLKDKTVYPSL